MAISTPSLEDKYLELLSSIDWLTVLDGLGLEPDAKGDYFIVRCPQCDQKECVFYPNDSSGSPQFRCNRMNNCKYESHILAHINGEKFPRGEEWRESVVKLADLSGISFEMSDNSNFHQKPFRIGNGILSDYWQFLQSRFPDSPAEKYIIERKLNPSCTPFGYFPSTVEEVYGWAEEVGYSVEELLSSHIIKEKDGSRFPAMYGRIAGAFIDQRGRVHNIWGRDLTGKVEGSKKYLNLDNSDVAHKKSPYGADRFRSGIVVWTEGYFDVIAAKESEVVAVASGMASIPKDMVNSLNGAHTIIIALDKDGAGGKGAFSFIEKNVNNENLKIFTINHELMNGCKDIAELYEKHGKEAVQNVFLPDDLEHVFTFAADHILSKHKTEDTWTPVAIENALSEAIKFDKMVTASSKTPLLNEYFWRNGIEKGMGLDENSLDDLIDNLNIKKEKEAFQNQLKSYSKLIGEKAEEGDFEGALNDLSKATKLGDSYSKQSTNENVYQQFLEPSSEAEIVGEIQNTSPGIRVGMKIGDVDLELPGGAISIIAGPTSHGKTTMLINQALGVLKNNPKKSVYFFSYEENKSAILSLFLNVWIGKEISKNNRRSIESFFRDGDCQHVKEGERLAFLNDKRSFFENLVITGRLNVFYSDMSVEELCQVIRFIKEKRDDIGAIFIDYMQLLNPKESGKLSRQEQLKHICLILKDCAVEAGLPIIIGAQFNRQVTCEAELSPICISEAGDIERIASLILGFWNRNFLGFTKEGNRTKLGGVIKESRQEIYIEILKGRKVGNGHNSVLSFNGNEGTIKNHSQQVVS